MSLEILPATKADEHIFAHLWPLYQYDLSVVGGTQINADGLFEDDNLRVHDYRRDLELWWRNADLLHPFLIRVHGRAAGLALVGAGPLFAGPDRDFAVIEFFVLRGFRGNGHAHSVATEIFEQFRGRWELKVLPGNAPALRFWRKTIHAVAHGDFTEAITYVDGDGDMVVFRFENYAPA
jgi:predicted acetyltransferase